MIGSRFAVSCAVLCAFAGDVVVTPAFAKTVTFRFNPPRKVSFIQTLKTRKVRTMGALGKTRDVGVAKVRVTMTREGEGYRFVATPFSFVMRRNGRRVTNPLQKVLTGITVFYDINKHGRIVAVRGFEQLDERMRDSLPRRQYRMLATAVTPESMASREIAEWNGRVGDFVGKSLATGEAMPSLNELGLPDGSKLTYYVASKVSRKAKCRSRRCVRVDVRYNSNGKALARFSADIVQKLSRLIGNEEPMSAPEAASVSGEGYRVIDPATMLIYKEVNKRVIKMTMNVPGRGSVPVSMRESRVYSFAYN